MKRGVRVVCARSAQASHARSACEASEKKKQKKKQRLSLVSLSVFGLSPAFCLTARAYLNTQKYGLFCSLFITWIRHLYTAKQSVFFSKSAKKSVKRGVRVVCSVFSLVPDLLFDCLRVLEYVKIQTVLQFSRLGSGCLLGNRIVLV